MKSTYQTESRKAIVEFLKLHSSEQFSIDTLLEKLSEAGTVVAKSSAYRIIGKLVEEETVRKVSLGERKEVLYQIMDSVSCHHHLHMQCTDCGRFVHMSEEATHRAEAILGNSGFVLDPGKTILYGKCENCQNK